MKITRRQIRRMIREAMQARYDHPVYGTVSDEEAEKLATHVGRIWKQVGPGQYKAEDDPYWSSPAGKIEKEMRALKLKIKSFMDQLKDVQENGPAPDDPPGVVKILKKSIMDDSRKFEKLQADLEAESRKGTTASRFPPTQMAISEASFADEERAERDLMAQIEEDVEELTRFIVMRSEEIGGPFRGPGIRKRAFELVLQIIREDYRG